MTSLLHAVEESLLRQKLLRPRQAVLVAVSGGLDSMALLDVLHGLQPRHRWRLAVAHFNHRLRGRASDADQALVLAEARRRGLACRVGSADVRDVARREKLSIETAARRVRHEFLAATARELRIRTVALAHHADDQVELCFLRLFRGAGGGGLGGMPASGPSPADPRVQLIRPLLGTTREALRNYAATQALRYREDASNASLAYARNKVRHQLLPRLEREYQPALKRIVWRAMQITGSESDFVRRVAEEWLASAGRGPWRSLHAAVQRQVLRLQLERLGTSPEFEIVEQLRAECERAVSVAPGMAVSRDAQGRLRGVPPAAPTFTSGEMRVQLIGLRGRIRFEGVELTWSTSARRSGGELPRFRPGCEYFDADRVGEEILLRHWRAGDRLHPIGMTQPVKVQDLFVNAGVPRAERHARLVATAADGVLLWVEGLRIGDGFKLDKGTVRRLKWQWRRGGVPVASERGT